MSEDESPGWQAINDALAPVYGRGEPFRHVGTMIPWELGGPDPLRGISVYRSESFGRPHWHYVTFGFTELYEKESPRTDLSGYGFELTLRLGVGPELEPPRWPLVALQTLGRYVFRSGNVFGAGDHAAFALGDDRGQLPGVGFVGDPELPGPYGSRNGAFEMLQLVGLHEDEVLAMKRWDGKKALEALSRGLPGLLTLPGRPSLASEPSFAAEVEAGIARDGSSFGFLPAPEIAIGDASLTLAANHLDALIEGLRYRLPFARPLVVSGADQRVLRIEAGPWEAARASDGWRLSAPSEAFGVVEEALRAGKMPAAWASLILVVAPGPHSA